MAEQGGSGTSKAVWKSVLDLAIRYAGILDSIDLDLAVAERMLGPDVPAILERGSLATADDRLVSAAISLERAPFQIGVIGTVLEVARLVEGSGPSFGDLFSWPTAVAGFAKLVVNSGSTSEFLVACNELTNSSAATKEDIERIINTAFKDIRQRSAFVAAIGAAADVVGQALDVGGALRAAGRIAGRALARGARSADDVVRETVSVQGQRPKAPPPAPPSPAPTPFRGGTAQGGTLSTRSSAVVPRARPGARGGTYVLRDPDTGHVVRTGRTNDLARRASEHGRDPALRDYVFDEVHRTDVYAEQRGLEQLLHEHYNAPLDRINAISPTNPRRSEYMDEARAFLEGR
jgi:hypothetical protein